MTGEEGATRGALLAVNELRLNYGAREVLRAVTVEVRRGEVVALMGLSGAGKTSALRAVAALQRFHGGRIVVDGFALEPGPALPESRLKPLRRRVGLVFQGQALPSQMWDRRLASRTPVAGLYLCGAATHPGGGVMGACGYNAAREILRDG